MKKQGKISLWDQWILFPPSKMYTNTILFEKQIGLISDSQSFSHRSKWQEPPGVINIFEAILSGIEFRFKKGLYENNYQYYLDIQTALQECLKVYCDHKEIVIEAFQNKTLLTLTKEKEAKVVVICEKCRKYSLISVSCPICHNTFYCDQACLKAHHIEHHKGCKESIKVIPVVLETLQVEIHSYSLSQNVVLYFEHETKFSLRGRGIKLFAELRNKLIQDKLIKAHNFAIKEYKNSLILTPESLETTLSPATSKSQRPAENFMSKSFMEIRDKEESHDGNKIGDDQAKNAKFPVVQEIKMILLEMGGIITDIIQERYPEKSTFVHIFLLP